MSTSLSLCCDSTYGVEGVEFDAKHGVPSIKLGTKMWIGRASLSVIFVETIRIDGEYYVSKVKFHHFASFYEVSIIVSLMEFLDFICIGGEGIISSLVEFLCVFDLSLSFFLSSSIYSNVKFSLADL